ncbi:CPBP family intramembrane glutamic endopeptidase [Hugenholtzia roseola]|uniref:CPBP family intramembrane glutamic endopeptidase n=1 Tax=Hugenholtzia roseola TaxID=1002 RepID=UPI00041C6474|nr:type II CAAX endopeptidase family protein [Hugenholtzia roseola]
MKPNTAPSSPLISFCVLITFLTVFYLWKEIVAFFAISIPSGQSRVYMVYGLWFIPPLLVMGFLFGFKNLFVEVGVRAKGNEGKEEGFVSNFLIAIFFALFCTLPMLVSSAVLGRFDGEFSWQGLFFKTLGAALSEEFLFRSFLFGVLFRRAKWGFIPAALLGAVIFGIAHLYQGSTWGELLGIFLVTAMGAGWFAWLFVEWRYNLWIPIFFHTFMNLSWVLFEVSPNALGGGASNIFRGITIALSIILTIHYRRKIRKEALTLKKSSLFWQI